MKKFFVAALFSVFALCGFAKEKFEINLFPTRLSENLDWWYRVPWTPELNTLSRAYTGERFNFIAVFGNVASKPAEDFSIRVYAKYGRDGKFSELPVKVLSGKLEKPEYAYPSAIVAAEFEKGEKLGEYTLRVDAENVSTGEKASKTVKVEHVEWSAPKPASAEESKRLFLGYNRNLSPDSLWRMFVNDSLSFYQRGDWFGGLNPSVYSFFVNAFARHPFLFDKLAESFAKASPRVRENTIILFSVCGRPAFDEKLLSESERALQKKFRELKIDADPYRKISEPADCDLLWGEFFASGGYRPARRLMDVLSRGADDAKLNSLVSKLPKGKKLSPEDYAEIKRLMCFRAARWSIKANASRDRLFAAYCFYAYRYDMKDRAAASEIDKIFIELKNESDAKEKKSASKQTAPAKKK